MYLVRHAQAMEIRMAVLQHVKDTAVLSAVAIKDPVAAVRHAAIKRIWNPEVWEMVAREGGKKDKHVRRIARERLDAWRKACIYRKKWNYRQDSPLCF